jgi:6-phosphofructokinase 1
MVAFERAEGPVYKCLTKLVDLGEVANQEKKVPREWINAAGNGLLKPFIDYATPLIQGETGLKIEGGLPRFAKLKKIASIPHQNI